MSNTGRFGASKKYSKEKQMTTQLIPQRKLLKELLDLRTQIYTEGQQLYRRWEAGSERSIFRYSAFNLACYLALRRRELQQALVPLGLSSLGRCEAHVLAILDAVIAALVRMCRERVKNYPGAPSLKHFARGWSTIEKNASYLFGKPATSRRVRIMVTLPAEAAQDYGWVRDILQQGADCVRINCAHDGKNEWKAMIRNVHRGARGNAGYLLDPTG
jgi:pyruvate kinase